MKWRMTASSELMFLALFPIWLCSFLYECVVGAYVTAFGAIRAHYEV